jgi:hypothetical protein
VRICLVSTDRQTCVQKQDTTVCPGCQETALVWRRLVVWVIDLERLVDVLEGWWGGCRRADGEAETVRLVRIVVWVLACDDDLDGIEGRVS